MKIKLKPFINELLIQIVIKRNCSILIKSYWVVKRNDCCLIIMTQPLLRLHLICILLRRLLTSVQRFHCLRVHSSVLIWVDGFHYAYLFTMITSEELIKIVSVINKTTYSSNPLLMSHLPTITDTIVHIINFC